MSTFSPVLDSPPTGCSYRVHIDRELEPFLARCRALYNDRSLPFHAPWWLQAWYTTFGCSNGCTPLLVSVQHRESGADAVLLPLVQRRQWGLSVVEFADAGVVDYTAPLLAPGWQGALDTHAAAQALWQVLRNALGGHDVLRLHKLLPQAMAEAGGQANPLAQVLDTQPCEMFGNQFSVSAEATDAASATRVDNPVGKPIDNPADKSVGSAIDNAKAKATASDPWETWRRTLDKRTRKEIERCWRVFHRSPEARFEHVTDPQQALALFETLEQQQSQRMQALHTPYRLDAPECRAFYRQAIVGGLAAAAQHKTGANNTAGAQSQGRTEGAQVVLTALRDGEHVVSALFGLANGHRYLGLRQSLGGDAWKACSPARLLDEQTARHLHAQGRQHFDFGIGDYHHKQALNMQAIPLLDACAALSWRGTPVVLAWRLRRWLKRQAGVMWLWQQRPGQRHAGSGQARASASVSVSASA